MKTPMKQSLESNSLINCMVVDDEPIAREGLMEYIRQIDYLNPVAQCKSAAEAACLLQKNKTDLIFLDIQMPKLTGIEFVKALSDPPLIIFTTAFSEYALEGFELDVVDYLLKPISFPRFLKAVDKARNYLYARNKELSITQDFFFIKCNAHFYISNIEPPPFPARNPQFFHHHHSSSSHAYITMSNM